MVKIWNGVQWIAGRIDPDARVFVVGVPVRFMPIDDDGFVKYGSVKYRLFSAEATTPHYPAMRAK